MYVPVVWVPVLPACCDTIKVPRDLDADPTATSQQALIGGASPVSVSVEYLVESGAASPSVSLTTTFDGTSSTWTDAAPAVGYHVQEALLSLKPGTKVNVTVNNATARVRWCETVCC
jgi:hypothetical protein